jgi:hypothetical protein
MGGNVVANVGTRSSRPLAETVRMAATRYKETSKKR